MPIARHHSSYTAAEFAALVDAAKANAERARNEARIAFWSDAAAWLGRTAARLFARRGRVYDGPVRAPWPRTAL